MVRRACFKQQITGLDHIYAMEIHTCSDRTTVNKHNFFPVHLILIKELRDLAVVLILLYELFSM